MARLFHRLVPHPTRMRAEPPDGGGGSSTRPPAPERHRRLPSRAHRHPLGARSQRALTNRAVRDSIVSLAGVVGRPVRNPSGAEIGRLVDVICRWTGDETYPPVTGLVVRVGRRLAFVSAARHRVHRAHPGPAQLGPARPRRFQAPPGRGDPRRAGPRPPAGRRGRRPGHSGRRPLSGSCLRPHPPGRGGRLGPEPAPPPRPDPVPAHPQPGPGHRLGRHPALRGDRGGRRPRVPAAHHEPGSRAAASRRAGRPARGPQTAGASEAARLAEPRRGRRRPRGDGSR